MILYYAKFYALNDLEDFKEYDGYFRAEDKTKLIRSIKNWCKERRYCYIRTIYILVYER